MQLWRRTLLQAVREPRRLGRLGDDLKSCIHVVLSCSCRCWLSARSFSYKQRASRPHYRPGKNSRALPRGGLPHLGVKKEFENIRAVPS